MKLKVLLLAIILALSTPAFAVEPVEVTADSFEIDDMTKNAVFTGSVVISRGSSLTVWADKVVVVYGSGGQSDMQSLTATGNVRIKTSQQNATGGQAVYDPGAQVLRLTQNVTVTNAQGTVSGPELVLDLANNTTTFSGSEGGRVTGVFTPQ